MPLFVLGTTALCCGNPPLDAARLDVIPAGLWGRAEGARTVLRSLAIAAALGQPADRPRIGYRDRVRMPGPSAIGGSHLSLLDLDPDLGKALDEVELAGARRLLLGEPPELVGRRYDQT